MILEDDCLIPVSRERRKDLKQKIWVYYEQKRKESKNRNKNQKDTVFKDKKRQLEDNSLRTF